MQTPAPTNKMQPLAFIKNKDTPRTTHSRIIERKTDWQDLVVMKRRSWVELIPFKPAPMWCKCVSGNSYVTSAGLRSDRWGALSHPFLHTPSRPLIVPYLLFAVLIQTAVDADICRPAEWSALVTCFPRKVGKFEGENVTEYVCYSWDALV